MCGIAGILDCTSNRSSRGRELDAMVLSQVHRGPDDNGSMAAFDGRVRMGHRRLSIIDPSSAGHQPMQSQSGRWTIVFNGEIYNAVKLAKAAGMTAADRRGHCDTEILVELIDRQGVQRTIEQCAGMFAFAALDSIEERLYLVRDRIGIKPLYVARKGDVIAFASESRAFDVMPEFSSGVSAPGLASLLTFGYIAGPRSIREHVSKVRPGTLVQIDFAQDLPTMRSIQWWSVQTSMDDSMEHVDDSQAIEAVRDAIEVSVRDRLMSDRPLGAFLSGGIDSSLVVAMMARVADQRVPTYSIGFEDPAWDESAHARAVAAHLGTHHVEHRVTEQDALDIIPSLSGLFDEPMGDSSQLPTLMLCRMARQGVVVALSGDGGDELFGGYSRYAWTMRLWSKLAGIPRPLRMGIASGMIAMPRNLAAVVLRLVNRLLPPHIQVRNPADKASLLRRVLPARDPHELYRLLSTPFGDAAAVMIHGPDDDSSQRFEPPFIDDPWIDMMTTDLQQYLPDDILTKVDRTSMSVGLEVRVPLLDHRLVELAWRLPLHMKIRNGQSKWVLRRILEDMVPASCWDRPKMGFGVPLGSWLRGPLRDWSESLLDESRLNREGIFRVKPIRRTWERHLAGNVDHGAYLWNILMFQSWMESRGSR